MQFTLKAIALAAMTMTFVAPTLAAAAAMDAKTMTCKDFSAMTATDMTAAVTALHAASADASMKMDDAANAAAVTATTAACVGHPEMMASDAMMKK